MFYDAKFTSFLRHILSYRKTNFIFSLKYNFIKPSYLRELTNVMNRHFLLISLPHFLSLFLSLHLHLLLSLYISFPLAIFLFIPFYLFLIVQIFGLISFIGACPWRPGGVHRRDLGSTTCRKSLYFETGQSTR